MYMTGIDAAIRLADGLVFYNEPIRRYVTNKLSLDKNTITFPGYTSNVYTPSVWRDKFTQDEVHCVYAGDVEANNQHRDYRDIFKRFSDAGVHVHVYAYPAAKGYTCYQDMADTSEYIHLEGEVSFDKLHNELSRYDIGLVLYNFTECEDLFIRTSLSGKVYDYLMSGLPLAVCKHEILSELVEKLHCGGTIDFSGDLKKQCEEIKGIKVGKEFSEAQGLTVEANIGRLINFFNRVRG
jgi:hypothetical protein